MQRVDSRGTPAAGPRQPAVLGDGRGGMAIRDEFVVGSAAEVQMVGVGASVGIPIRSVVHLAFVAGHCAAGTGTTLIASVADDALINGGKPAPPRRQREVRTGSCLRSHSNNRSMPMVKPQIVDETRTVDNRRCQPDTDSSRRPVDAGPSSATRPASNPVTPIKANPAKNDHELTTIGKTSAPIAPPP